jgi:hypothetical protein
LKSRKGAFYTHAEVVERCINGFKAGRAREQHRAVVNLFWNDDVEDDSHTIKLLSDALRRAESTTLHSREHDGLSKTFLKFAQSMWCVKERRLKLWT